MTPGAEPFLPSAGWLFATHAGAQVYVIMTGWVSRPGRASRGSPPQPPHGMTRSLPPLGMSPIRRLALIMLATLAGLAGWQPAARAQSSGSARFAFADTTLLRDTLGAQVRWSVPDRRQLAHAARHAARAGHPLPPADPSTGRDGRLDGRAGRLGRRRHRARELQSAQRQLGRRRAQCVPLHEWLQHLQEHHLVGERRRLHADARTHVAAQRHDHHHGSLDRGRHTQFAPGTIIQHRGELARRVATCRWAGAR